MPGDERRRQQMSGDEAKKLKNNLTGIEKQKLKTETLPSEAA
jgi:hypothetical protein